MNELLALQELITQDRIGQKMMPLIEPVKFSTTLVNTINVFIQKGHCLGIIRNPHVASFITELKQLEDSDDEKNRKKHHEFMQSLDSNYVLSAYIISKKSPQKIHETLESIIEEQGSLDNTVIVADSNSKTIIEDFRGILSASPGIYNLMQDDRAFKRSISKNRVLFEDRFIKLSRNVDYQNEEDELFSEDHLYYEKEGFIGFSDYSIVGDEFRESGFAPNAIAIHIVYFKGEVLYVHHFTSDSNDDRHNPAKKYYEALNKLIAWKSDIPNMNTIAMNIFQEHYENGSYPGLGSIKKLCVMHHLELISRYLDGGITG
jgi:hypothetical protein